MVIESVNSKYQQKSRIFCYSLLGIKRYSAVRPKETYLSWKGIVSFEDPTLLLLYDLKNDHETFLFEESLKKNPLFVSRFYVEDPKRVNDRSIVYMFDLSSLDAYPFIIKGQYSKISQKAKQKILAYYSESLKNKKLVQTWLYPHNYRSDYAKALNVHISLINETCDPPDPEKETLTLKLLKEL